MTEATAKKGYVKGSLKQVPVAKVLHFIHLAKKTGVLAIAKNKKKVHIHFLDGEVAYVTSSYFPGISLGDFLLKEGKISLQIHEESLEKIRGTEVKQGTYLVENGYLSPHDLVETLNRQVLEKLFSLFEWIEGDFYFKEGDIIKEELRLVKIEVQKLIYQGIRDHMNLSSLPLEFKGRKESVLFRRLDVSFRLESLGLGPIDTRILSFVNGQYTLRQIVALVRLKKKAIYRILYGLFLAGVIAFPEGIVKRKKETAVEGAVLHSEREKKEGYEINVSNNLISEALESVDRIHEEVKKEAEEVDEKITASPLSGRGGKVTDTLDELGYKLDEVLSEEKPSPEIDEQFGFDNSMPDGFVGSDISDASLKEMTSSFEDVSVDDQGDQAQSSDSDDYTFDESADDQDMAEYEPDLTDEESEAAFSLNIEDFSDPGEVKNQGIILLEEGRFEEAEMFLQKSTELLPEDFELYAYLGWCVYNLSKSRGEDYEQGEEIIKQGMGPGKSNYLHFLFLGKIYYEEDQYEFAELHFVKTLEMNIECAEAKDLVKLIHAK